MRTSTAAIAILFGLVASVSVGQPPATFDANDYIIGNVPIVEPPVLVYQNFFSQSKDLGRLSLSAEVRRSLGLTDQEFQSLLTITADLATEGRFLEKALRPLMFEARMQAAESGSVSPAMQAKLRDLQDQWKKTILDHVQRLKGTFGEARFQKVDEFIRSGQSMFQSSPLAKREVK
jgi:hypothetical protein